MKYVYYMLIGLVSIFLPGCSTHSAGTNMQDAKKAVAAGKINESIGGSTAFDHAVREPNNSKIIIYLLKNGANPKKDKCTNQVFNIMISHEYTLNQYSRNLELLENFETLLKYGVICDKDRALYVTMVWGNNRGNKHLPLVKILLSNGANPNKKYKSRSGSYMSANDYLGRQEQKAKVSSSNDREMWGKIAAIGMGAAIASNSSLDSAAQTEFMTNYSADVMNDDMSMSNTKQWKDKTVQENKQRSKVSSSINSSHDRKLAEVDVKKITVVPTNAEVKHTYYNMSGTGAINNNNMKQVGKITYERCANGKCYSKYIYIMSYEDTKHATNYSTCKSGIDCDSYDKLVDAQRAAIKESWAESGSEIKNFAVSRYY